MICLGPHGVAGERERAGECESMYIQRSGVLLLLGLRVGWLEFCKFTSGELIKFN